MSNGFIGAVFGGLGTALFAAGIYEERWWQVGAASMLAWIGLLMILRDD
jgi:hypothetical protein